MKLKTEKDLYHTAFELVGDLDHFYYMVNTVYKKTNNEDEKSRLVTVLKLVNDASDAIYDARDILNGGVNVA